MNKKIALLSMALIAATSSAHAELIIEKRPAAQSTVRVQQAPAPQADVKAGTGMEWSRHDRGTAIGQSAPRGQGAVTESGRRPHQLETSGWAKDMPLPLALRQVVPLGFEVKENGVALSESQTVSWSGDRPWTETLNTVASSGNFVAHVDWDRKEVSLAPRLSPTSSFSVNSTQSTPSFVPAQRPIAPAVQPWSLDSNLTLKENVERWASRAGWKVVWEAADYPIAASAQFTGDFSSPEGPLATLIEAYEMSDQPLVAQLTTKDKVVYVRNKHFERAQVVPMAPTDFSNL